MFEARVDRLEAARERLATARAGAAKLGADLTLGSLLARGTQERPTYTLEMELYQAHATEDPRLSDAAARAGSVTLYTDWRWGRAEHLRASAALGSLCSELFLMAERRPLTV